MAMEPVGAVAGLQEWTGGTGHTRDFWGELRFGPHTACFAINSLVSNNVS